MIGPESISVPSRSNRTLEHRPDERSDHVAQEAVGRDREFEPSAVDLPGRGADVAAEDVVLGLRRRERTEVVLARQECGSRHKRLALDRPGPPERATSLERRAQPAGQYAVTIRARD